MRGTEGRLQSVINESYDRLEGDDAQLMNLKAGQALSEALRTTLGPNGMDKMLVDSLGGAVVTNDGATILQEMDLSHPGAKLVAEVAQAQEGAAGDG
ncbi:thermosome subunit, partial [Haloferax sp. Atlit-47N]